uniref:Bm13142 n=1 Tax=Brugia malayi TaxID=6279 RepID=A0A1I9G149_BRUMA|nr:Bm13142 [Brugia malayi]
MVYFDIGHISPTDALAVTHTYTHTHTHTYTQLRLCAGDVNSERLRHQHTLSQPLPLLQRRFE